MWFNAAAALAEIQAGEKPGFDPPPPCYTCYTCYKQHCDPPHCSTCSTCSTPPRVKSRNHALRIGRCGLSYHAAPIGAANLRRGGFNPWLGRDAGVADRSPIARGWAGALRRIWHGTADGKECAMTDRNNGDTTGRDGSGRFAPGNPGRPQGARHKATMAALALLDGEAETLTRKAVEMALAGDGAALRLCLERIAPPRRDAPVVFALPAMQSAADAAKAAGAVLGAVAGGDLTPTEGAAIVALVEAYRRALETTELEARVAALESGDK